MKCYKVFFIYVLFISGFLFGETNAVLRNFVPTAQELKDGAVVLQKKTVVHIDKNAKKEIVKYYLIAILNDEAARDYAQMDFGYNSYYTDRKLDFARVIDKEYKQRDVEKDAVQIRNPQNYNSYDDTKSIVFSLPAVKAGTFIEIQLTSRDKQCIIENETSGIENFMVWQSNKSTNRLRVDSVRESQFIVTIDKERQLYYHINKQAEFSTEETNNTIQYKWKIRDIKKQKIEKSTLYSYNKFIPLISYSTIKEWKKLNSYFFPYYNTASHPDKEIVALAKHIVGDSDTIEEKTKRLFEYMQENVKYVFAHLGRGGMLPHPANKILQNQYGDCKDQTTLFIALLKAVNIDAYPALIHSYMDDFESESAVSSLYFNHVITYIPSLDRFIDTTGYNALYPGISWMLAEKNSFILNEKQGEMKKLAVPKKEKVNIDLNISVVGKVLKGTLHYKPSVQMSNNYKNMIANMQNAKLLLEKDFSTFYQRASTVSFIMHNADTAKKPLAFVWKFKIPQEDENLSQYIFSGLTSSFLSKLLPLMIMERPEDRVHGFRTGYPIQFNIHTIFVLSDNAYSVQPNLLPDAFDNRYYSYLSKYHEANKSIEINEIVEVKKYKIPRKQYEDFYQKTREVVQKTNWIALFKKDQFRSKELQLKEDIQQTKSIEKMIKLAEHYLDVMKYDESKKLIKEVLLKEPDNAKAHYVYGIILGYMDEFDQSEVELLKARGLGYKK